MQRRAGKGQAHISPPRGPDRMGSDIEKTSRLNQRSFGVTNRIWIILVLFLSILLLTRYILPSDGGPNSSSARHRLLGTDLKPKNYLNVSDVQQSQTSPFPFCPSFGDGDELAKKYGAITLSKTRLHLGSGARVQRVVNKALSGLPVTISVLGGSVSACHGAGNDPLSPSCYPSKFFDWWNIVFPHPASELTNGAMRRTNSDYFSFCSSHHIPDVTDLIIVELDTDDRVDATSRESFETLIRSILIRPDHPAVILLGHFSPQSHQQHGFAGADHWHSAVAQFYDIPHISAKPILYPGYMDDPTSVNQYFADAVLANPSGHDIISDVLIAYLQVQTCAAWAAAVGRSYDALPSVLSHLTPGDTKQPTDARGLFGGVGQRKGAPGGDAAAGGGGGLKFPSFGKQSSAGSPSQFLQQIPQARISSRPSDLENFEEVLPFCASANDLVNPLPTSIFAGTGWAAYHPPTGSNSLSSTSHYWYSSLPTSKLRVSITIGAGDVGVYYLKEPQSVVGADGSAISCWVDDNYSGKVEIENSADIGEPTPTLQIIDRGVASGSHYVECQLEGEEGDRNVPSFRILGIFAI